MTKVDFYSLMADYPKVVTPKVDYLRSEMKPLIKNVTLKT